MIGYQANKNANTPISQRLGIGRFRSSKNPELADVLNTLTKIQATLKKGSDVTSFKNAMAEKSREIARLKRIASKEQLTGQDLETFRSDIYKLASRMQTFAVAKNELPNIDPIELQMMRSALRTIQAEFRTGADLAPHKFRVDSIAITPPTSNFSQST